MGCFSLPSFKKWLLLGVVHQNKGVTSKLPLNKRKNDDSPQDSGGYPISKPTGEIRCHIYLSERRFSWTNLIWVCLRKGYPQIPWFISLIPIENRPIGVFPIFGQSHMNSPIINFVSSILDRKITCHQYSRGCRHAVQDTFAWTWRWNKALAPAKGVGRKVGTLTGHIEIAWIYGSSSPQIPSGNQT